ncbi:MAG: hypothetical protein Q4A32_01100 [Lachnospiraceae bacterium]|nr:hypothetical protein [Lachnospiraceae bacterium]
MDRMERLQCVNDTLRTLRYDNTLLGEMCLRIQEYVSEERFLPSELQDNLLRLVQDMREGQNKCRAGYKAVVGSADLPDTYAEAERRLKKQHELFCKEDIVQSAVIFKRLVTDNPSEADALKRAQENTVIVSPANMTMERCRERYKPYMDFLAALSENNAGVRIGYVRELEKHFAPELIAGAVITRDIYDPEENGESYEDDLDDYDEGIEESVASPSYLSEESSDEDADSFSDGRLEAEEAEAARVAEDVIPVKKKVAPTEEAAGREREVGAALAPETTEDANEEITSEAEDTDAEVPERGDAGMEAAEAEDADAEVPETGDAVWETAEAGDVDEEAPESGDAVWETSEASDADEKVSNTGYADEETLNAEDVDEETSESGDDDWKVPEAEDADGEVSETGDDAARADISYAATVSSDGQYVEPETADNNDEEDVDSEDKDSRNLDSEVSDREAISEETEGFEACREYVVQGDEEALPGFRENAVSEVTAEDAEESVYMLSMSDEMEELPSDADVSTENVKAFWNWPSNQAKPDDVETAEFGKQDKQAEPDEAENAASINVADEAEAAASISSDEPEVLDYLADFDENYIEYYLQTADAKEPMSAKHLPTWPGQGGAFKIEGVKDVLTALGFQIDTLEELDRIRGKYENYNVVLEQMDSQPARDDAAFASFRREACMTGFRIVCLYGAFSGEELSRAFREIGNRYHTLILFQNPMTQGIRRSLIKLVRRPGLQKEFAVLDKVAYRYLDDHYKPDTINDMFLDIVMPGPEMR